MLIYNCLCGVSRYRLDRAPRLGVQAPQFRSWRMRCNLDVVLSHRAGLDVFFVLFGMLACLPRISEREIARLVLSRLEVLGEENARRQVEQKQQR